MNDRIRLLTAADLNWPFSDGPTRPSYSQTRRFGWRGTVNVDPFVCYHHDMPLVEACVEDIEAKFPIGCLPLYFVLSHETESRTNGWCECEGLHDDEKKKAARAPFEPVITLGGKRIPIHPAMTRYLVPHEYGHAVQFWVMHKLGLYEDRGEDDFLRKYAEIRGCEFSKRYGGGQWHTNTQEIFANDFRIIVGEKEAEFWPHPVVHPLHCDSILNYWAETLVPLAFREAEAEPAGMQPLAQA